MTPQRAVLLSLLGSTVIIVTTEGVPDARRVVAFGMLYFVLSFMADAGVPATGVFALLLLLTLLFNNWQKFFIRLGIATSRGGVSSVS